MNAVRWREWWSGDLTFSDKFTGVLTSKTSLKSDFFETFCALSKVVVDFLRKLMKFKKGKRNSSSFVFWNREIRKFYVVVLQWRQRNVPKSVPNRQSCYCFANLNLLLVWRSRCRCLRKDWLCDAFSWCTVKSMIPRVTWFYLVWRVCIQRRVKSRVGYWRHSTRKHRISNSFHATHHDNVKTRYIPHQR